MPKPRYWGVHRNRSRHGRMRFYFHPDPAKPRIRLPDDYGSAAFEAAYRAAFAGLPLPGQGLAQARKAASRGKLGWLIKLYLQGPEFADYRPATRKQRRTVLEKLGIEKGTVEVEDIDKAAIQASMNARRDKPNMANVWFTAVTKLFEWATQAIFEGGKPSLLSTPTHARE